MIRGDHEPADEMYFQRCAAHNKCINTKVCGIIVENVQRLRK